MMKPNFRRPAVLFLGLLLLPSLVACSDAWGDFIFPGRDSLPEINSSLLPSDTASKTNPDTETEMPRYDFDTDQIHSGVGIPYQGHADSPYNRLCVVIDAGHQETAGTETELTGSDVGEETYAETAEKMSVGHTGSFTGQAEHELNLAVAIQLRNELCSRGYSVVMIRETSDARLSEAQRAELASNMTKQYDHTVYVRIHAASSENTSERGAMTVYASANNPNPACAANYAYSRALSESVLDGYCASTVHIRKHKTPLYEDDSLTAVNRSPIPTTTLVLGFLSFETEDVLMSYEDFRADAASGIADGIEAYFRRVTEGEILGDPPEIYPETEYIGEPTPDSAVKPETQP